MPCVLQIPETVHVNGTTDPTSGSNPNNNINSGNNGGDNNSGGNNGGGGGDAAAMMAYRLMVLSLGLLTILFV